MSQSGVHTAPVLEAIHALQEEVRSLTEEVRQNRRQLRSMERQLGAHLLSRQEAAERLGCSVKTIIRREEAGKLERLDIEGIGIRYLASEVDALASEET